MDTVRSLCGVDGPEPEPAWTVGLDRIESLLGKHSIRATFFVVGRDALHPDVFARLRRLVAQGHELAVHTWSHPQAWARLSRDQKADEIRRTADQLEKASGIRPVGFRAPGWNVDEETLDILAEEGFRYDSSVFPTVLSPALKLAYGVSTRFRLPTLGRLAFLAAPRRPYRPGARIWRRGSRAIRELPLSVTPGLRLPVFSTWYLWQGVDGLDADLDALAGEELNFMFHPADFLDASEVAALVQAASRGTYIPAGLKSSWRMKEPLVQRMMAAAAARFRMMPLRDLLNDTAA